MKTVIFFIVGAIAAEIAIILIATIVGLAGITMLVVTALLPVALIAAAVFYLFTKFSQGKSGGEENKGSEADK